MEDEDSLQIVGGNNSFIGTPPILEWDTGISKFVVE